MDTLIKKRIIIKKKVVSSKVGTDTDSDTNTDTSDTFKKISLYDAQKIHVNNICRIWDNFNFAFDFSMLGTGKTFTSSYLALNYGFKHVIVICPVSVESKWSIMKKDYGVPIKGIYSFTSIRSTKNKHPSHGLLLRYDSIDNSQGHAIEKTSFSSTDLYLNMVSDGVLLIIDEIQNIKNVNSQFIACKELIFQIVNGISNKNRKSRVLLLSGSPVDKQEQITTLLRSVNIIQSDELSVFNPYSRDNVWTGFQDFLNFCFKHKISRNIYDIYKIPNQNTGVVKIFRQIIYSVFQDLLKPILTSAMPPIISNVKLNKINAFYSIKGPDDILYEQGVNMLQKSIGFNNQTNEINHKGAKSLSAITRALILIETAKVNTMVKIAKKRLTNNINEKIVIVVNYNESIKSIYDLLIKYKPLILNGQVNKTDREKISAQFNEDNNNHRVLICNLAVVSVGIDLDDKYGGRPRFCIANPNYKTIDLYQLGHRFQRIDTKSDSTIHFIYGKRIHELQVLNALSSKSEVMKNTTDIQAHFGVQFLCDIPSSFF